MQKLTLPLALAASTLAIGGPAIAAGDGNSVAPFTPSPSLADDDDGQDDGNVGDRERIYTVERHPAPLPESVKWILLVCDLLDPLYGLPWLPDEGPPPLFLPEPEPDDLGDGDCKL